MKKISLLAVILLGALSVFSQDVVFGLKGGVNLASWTNASSGIGYQNRTGFHAGGLAQIHLSPQFSVQPEVVYSSQGTKYTLGNQTHNLALNYINVPLMLQAKVGGGLYAEAGPQVGFISSANDKVNNVETGLFSAEDFKNTDVALGFGLGYQGSSGIGVDARYNLGLSNVNNAGSNAIKNNVIQLGLFIKFGSAKR